MSKDEKLTLNELSNANGGSDNNQNNKCPDYVETLSQHRPYRPCIKTNKGQLPECKKCKIKEEKYSFSPEI